VMFLYLLLLLLTVLLLDIASQGDVHINRGLCRRGTMTMTITMMNECDSADL